MKVLKKIFVIITIISMVGGLIPAGVMPAWAAEPYSASLSEYSRQIAANGYPFVFLVNGNSLTPDTEYQYKALLTSENPTVGDTWNSVSSSWISPADSWVDAPVLTTDGTGTFSDTLVVARFNGAPGSYGLGLYLCPMASGNCAQEDVLQPAGTPPVQAMDMATEGGWIGGAVYQADQTTPFASAIITVTDGVQTRSIYLSEDNGVTEGFEGFPQSAGDMRIAVLATGEGPGQVSAYQVQSLDLSGNPVGSGKCNVVVVAGEVTNLNLNQDASDCGGGGSDPPPGQPQGTISGTVTDLAGTPIADATISIQGPGGSSTTTDVLGEFSVLLNTGDYQLSATAVGFVTEMYRSPGEIEGHMYGTYNGGAAQQVSVTEDGTTTVNFDLEEGITFAGTVYDDGDPGVGIASVSVMAQFAGQGQGPSGGTQTDAQGTYSFTVPASSYKLSAGFGNETYYQGRYFLLGNDVGVLDWNDASTRNTDTANADFHLSLGGAISGTISFEGGTPDPQPSIQLTAAPVAGEGSYTATMDFMDQTYRFSGLPAGDYLVWAVDQSMNATFESQYYDGHAAVEDAVPVSVTVSANTSAIDFTMLPDTSPPQVESSSASTRGVYVTFSEQVSQSAYSQESLANYTLYSPYEEGGVQTVIPLSSPPNSLNYEGDTRTVQITGVDLPVGQTYRVRMIGICDTISTPTDLHCVQAETPIWTAIGTVVEATDPYITSISPTSGFASSSDVTVTITGENFGDPQPQDAAVTLYSDPVQGTIISWSDTEIVASFDLTGQQYDNMYHSIRVTANSQESNQGSFTIIRASDAYLTGRVLTPLAAPVAGAGINLSGNGPGDNCYSSNGSVETDADGIFVMVLGDGVPGNTCRISVSAPAGSVYASPADRNQALNASGETDAGDFTLLSSVVAGIILPPIGSTPQANVNVSIHDASYTVQGNSQTDSEGVFKFAAALSQGTLSVGVRYTIEVQQPYPNPLNYGQASYSFTLGSECTPITPCTIRFTGVNVIGTVKTPLGDIDEFGAPISTPLNPFPDMVVPNANVSLHDQNWTFSRWSNTDADGNFSFGGVPAGSSYILEINPPWGQPEFAAYSRTQINDVAIAASGITDLNATKGTGEPAALRFSLSNVRGRVVFPDVVDQAEAGVPNSWVNVRIDGPGQNFWAGANTNAEGYFSLNLSTASNFYVIEAQPPQGASGYSTGTLRNVVITAEDLTDPAGFDLGEIQLGLPNVQGVVMVPESAGDTVVGWAQISINSNSYWQGTQSAEDGSFAIGPVPEGTYQVEVRPPMGLSLYSSRTYTLVIAGDGSKTLDGEAVEDMFTLRLGTPNVTGALYTPAGEVSPLNPLPDEAVPNANINIHPNGPGNYWSSSQTGQGGSFSFSGLNPGAYILEIQPPWGESEYGSYSRTQVEVMLIAPDGDCGIYEPGVSCFESATPGPQYSWDLGTIRFSVPNIVGFVRTPAGDVSALNPSPDTLVPYANLNIHTECSGPCGGGIWRWTQSDAAGQFTVNLPEGAYTIEVSSEGNGDFATYARNTYRLLLDVDGDGNATFNDLPITDGIDLRLTMANVLGTVLNPDGIAATNAWVEVHSFDWQQWAGANADQTGQFSLGGLADGTYQLSMRAPWGESGMVDPGTYSIVIADGIGTLLENGDATTPDNTLRFVAPSKTITATVTYAGSDPVVPVTDATLFAWKEDGSGYSESRDNTDGVYTLLVGPGRWTVMVRADYSYGVQPDWVYNSLPKRASFNSDNAIVESTALTFEVVETDATITGTVVDPDGNTLSNTWVDVRNQGGSGNGGPTDSHGIFTVRVAAGTYNVMVYPSSSEFSAPQIASITVDADSSYDVGTIQLTAKSSHITGYVLDEDNTGVESFYINAFQMNGAGWASATTDATGAYDLTVGAGTWQVMVFSGSDNYLYIGGPQQVTVLDNETSDGNNFNVLTATSTIEGRLVYEDCSSDPCSVEPVSSVSGVAWVEELNMAGTMSGGGGVESAGTGGGKGSGGGGAAGGYIQNGNFTLQVPAGDYHVGVTLLAGSGYSFDHTAFVTASEGDESSVDIYLLPNSASISGQFVDSEGTPVAGLRGGVFASTPSGAFQEGEVNADGSYSIEVASGEWQVSAWTDQWSGDYIVVPSADNVVNALADQDTTFDFTVIVRDAYVRGTIMDPAAQAMGNVWVYATTAASDAAGPEGKGNQIGTFSAADGSYELRVAAGTYKVGIALPPWSQASYVSPAVQEIQVDSAETIAGINFQFTVPDATLAGTVSFDGSPSPAFVRAWTEEGAFASVEVGADGVYSLSISGGQRWHLEAILQQYDGASSKWKLYKSAETVIETETGANPADLELLLQNDLPEAVSVTFDASQPKTLRIVENQDACDSDPAVCRTTIVSIPAGAIETSGQVTVTATPKAGMVSQSGARPISVGYSFEAKDSSGRAITHTFYQNITISFPYTTDGEGYVNGTRVHENDISASYWDTTTNTWRGFNSMTVDKTQNVITITTNHFTDMVILGTGDSIAPTLSSINWTDVNTNGVIDSGDTLAFTFVEEMLRTTIDATNVDTRLLTSGGHTYGASPTVTWNSPTDTIVTVTLGTSPSIVGSDTVNPSSAVLDASGNADGTVTGLKIDTVSPVISQVTAVTTPTNDDTPNYIFHTYEAGTITYSGDCTSATTAAVYGDNTVSFAHLADGVHNNCTIRVTDSGANLSNLLSVPSFTVDTTAPVITVTNPNTSPAQSKTVTASVDDGTLTMKTLAALADACAGSTGYAAYASTTFTAEADNGKAMCYRVADALGNTSYQKSIAIAGIDRTGPVAPVITMTDPVNDSNKTAVSITGTGEANATLTYAINDTDSGTPAVIGIGTVSAGGAISLTGIDVNILSRGILTASVTLTDAAGNAGTAGTDTATFDATSTETLIKGLAPLVYLVQDLIKHAFPSAEIFFSRGYSFDEITTVVNAALDDYTTGDAVTYNTAYRNGQNIKGSSAAVYFVEGGLARIYPSWGVYLLGGHADDGITAVTDLELSYLSEGAPMAFTARADGTLIKGTAPAVYLIADGAKRIFPSAEVFLSHGYAWSSIVTVLDEELSMYDDGAVMAYVVAYRNGQVIRGSAYAVYKIEEGQKRKFGTWAQFAGWGYGAADIVDVSDLELTFIPDGDDMGFAI